MRKAPYCYPVRIGGDACQRGVSDVQVYDGRDPKDGMHRYHSETCMYCELEAIPQAELDLFYAWAES